MSDFQRYKRKRMSKDTELRKKYNEGYWLAIEETLYIYSIPGLAKSIIEEMKKTDSEFLEEIDKKNGL